MELFYTQNVFSFKVKTINSIKLTDKNITEVGNVEDVTNVNDVQDVNDVLDVDNQTLKVKVQNSNLSVKIEIGSPSYYGLEEVRDDLKRKVCF